MKQFTHILLIASVLSPAVHADLWSYLFPQPRCAREVVQRLYRNGMEQFYSSEWAFRRHVAQMERELGVDPSQVQMWFDRVNQNPEIVSLMRGIDVPRERHGLWRLSGGWGQDHLLVDHSSIWKMIRSNLPHLGERYHQRLKLPWSQIFDLLADDETSMGDSAWVLFHPTRPLSLNARLERSASLKVTFFDFYSSPAGLFPRYILRDPSDGSEIRLLRSPADLNPAEAQSCEEGSLLLQSSLGEWGLLPLEKEREEGKRVWLAPEHAPSIRSDVPIQYRAFTGPFFQRHALLLHALLDRGLSLEERAQRMTNLIRFRSDFLPLRSLRVAEIGRFNIPPEASQGGRPQLFFGLLVLLYTRPIEVLYVHAPKTESNLLVEDYRKLTFQIVHENKWGYRLRTSSDELKGALRSYLNLPTSQRYLTDEQRAILDSMIVNRAKWRIDAQALW